MGNNRRYSTRPNADIQQIIKKKYAIPRKDLVEDERKTRELQSKNNRLQLNKLRAVADRSIQNVNDATGIMELLPDIRLVKEILVASILSPNDLTEINMDVISTDSNIPAEIVDLVKQHFTGEYNLEGKMAEMLEKMLFETGSYSVMPLPAKTISTIMHANSRVLESFNSNHLLGTNLPNLGYIGQHNTSTTGATVYAAESFAPTVMYGDKKAQWAFEGADFKSKIEISDNPIYLVGPALLKTTQRINVRKIMQEKLGLEGVQYKEFGDTNLYMKKMYDMVETVMLQPTKIDEIAENLDPIIIVLPAEAVIPVFVPGEPDNHIGYYIILDEFGNPINGAKNSNFFKELNDRLENTIVSSSNTVVRTSLGVQELNSQQMIDNFKQPIIDAYITQMEKELRESVKNGLYGQTVSVAKPDQIYRVMLARQLEKQFTRALYVPAEMMSYFAFDYDDLGMGVSLIEKTKLYSSLRAILMFAEVMAGVKNSVPQRKLNITLDEFDPDPQGTIESAINEFAILQTNALPLGKLNPSDIVDSLQRSGIQVNVDGKEAFSNMSIEVEDKRREMTKPDTELSELLKKQQYSGFGVSPELADRGLEGDFATGITASNLLHTKRVMVYQVDFEDQCSEFIHKYIWAGGPLFKKIKEKWAAVQMENKPPLEHVINSIRILLPKPDTAIIAAQSEAFTEYATFIEIAVDAYVNPEMLRGMTKGEVAQEAVDALKKSLVDFFKRQYMRMQNILPELDKIISNEDLHVGELIKQHHQSIFRIIADVIPELYKSEYTHVDAPVNKELAKLDKQREKDNPGGVPDFGTGSSGAETETELTGGGEEDNLDMTELNLGGEEEEEGGEPENPEEEEPKEEPGAEAPEA